VYPFLKDCEVLTALGSGEFFANNSILRFVKNLSQKQFPKLKVNITTNAQLVTKYRLDELENLHGMLNTFHVSIDAAKKETYEKLRIGAKWEILCKSMDILAEMKAAGTIDSIHASFVVQAENYRQMPTFIELTKQWNVDTVEFRRLTNWGTYDNDEFKKIDVHSPAHPCYSDVQSIVSNINNTEMDIHITENLLQDIKNKNKL